MSQNAPNGGNAVNLKTGKKPPKHRSKFDLSYRMACTPRYGFVTPFFKFDGIPGDRVSLRSGHNLRTMSLKSPLFQNLRMNKDFYAVPMKALLPLNWDKLFNNPVQGEDINPLAINTLIGSAGPQAYDGFMHDLMSNVQILARKTYEFKASDFQYFTYCLMIFEMFAGKGNLFETFRIDPWFGINRVLSHTTQDATKAMWAAWHAYLDALVQKLGDVPFHIDYYSDDMTTTYTKTYDIKSIKERFRMYYDMCENSLFSVPIYSISGLNYTDLTKVLQASLQTYFGLSDGTNGISDYCVEILTKLSEVQGQYVNIAPILAYQMIMAEYFTNDKVDMVYNSDMFRQVIYTYGLMQNVAGNAYNTENTTFMWNGKMYSYDAFSAMSLRNIAAYGIDTGTVGQSYMWVGLMNMLFGLQKGLKYIDYFTGSRTRPIAVGDLNVAVNQEKVDVINITQKIQWQRFLNQVNRIGPDAKNYLKGIFDVEERQHIDVPVKIGHIDETVYGEEVQNTADAQQSQPNSITTNLKSRGSNYAFEFNITESTIVLGLVSFSIRRFYNNGDDPFSFKKDRFDMFNPYLQFTGDQPIYLREIAKDSDHDDIFGYAGRYAEYKNSVDYAVGDFKDALASWIFSDSTLAVQTSEDGKHVHVSPEFIRQVPTELDDYYLNMTGTIPGDRYHFIVVFDNNVEASRDMVFNPQILG